MLDLTEFDRNEACSGLCSKCYQEQLKRQRHETTETKEDKTASLISPEPVKETSNAISTTMTKPKSNPPSEPRKNTPARCIECKRRVGLTGFVCKCGDVFCAKHRHADSHACTFDHRSAERALLAKQNPVIKGAKFERL